MIEWHIACIIRNCGGLSTTLCGVATTRLWVTATVTPRAVSLRSVTLALLPFPGPPRNWGRR